MAETTNTTNTNGEDLLLTQIDAFRDKAMQIQQLVNVKEDRVVELERQLQEKELKNQELQATIDQKQHEADELVSSVEGQVDRMLASLKENMDGIENRIGQQVDNSEQATAEQNQAVKETMEGMSKDLTSLKAEISEKVHSENVQVYRNIQEMMQQELMQKMEKTSEENAQLQKAIKSVRGKVTFVTVVAILNLIVVAAMLLSTFGLLPF